MPQHLRRKSPNSSASCSQAPAHVVLAPGANSCILQHRSNLWSQTPRLPVERVKSATSVQNLATRKMSAIPKSAWWTNFASNLKILLHWSCNLLMSQCKPKKLLRRVQSTVITLTITLCLPFPYRLSYPSVQSGFSTLAPLAVLRLPKTNASMLVTAT